jgi:hypothetical protein
MLVSEGARHPIDPVHSLTRRFRVITRRTSLNQTQDTSDPHRPTGVRLRDRMDLTACAPATRVLCQLLATIGAVTCALRETTPKRLTATGLALPSRYRIGSDCQQKRWCIVIRLRCSLARYAQCERDGAAVPRILTIARRSVSVQEN